MTERDVQYEVQGRQVCRVRRHVYSIWEGDDWWRDARGKRRAWNVFNAACEAAEEGQEHGQTTVQPTDEAQTTSHAGPRRPPGVHEVPRQRVPRVRHPEASLRERVHSWCQEERKRRGRGTGEVTYGDVVEEFNLSGPMEAIDLLWGKSP